jgi:flagellar motor switch protein FliG
VDAVAEILNMTGRAVERTVLESLAQDDAELVEQIRRKMFVFDDILKISNKDIQTILKNVESAQWATALKGQSEELKDKVLSNMSQRAADMLREEMDFLGAVRASEVEKVQQQIVDIIRQLEETEQIKLEVGEEEEFIS